MKKIIVVLLMALAATILQNVPVSGNEFKQREAIIAQYKKWLDSLGPEGSKFWVRLDPRQRPHRLYLGEGFYRADKFWVRLDPRQRPHRLYLGEGFYRAEPRTQERFVDTFSNYLAGHPEKFMLIDLFDATTNKAVGEYGFGGFKLYPQRVLGADSAQKRN